MSCVSVVRIAVISEPAGCVVFRILGGIKNYTPSTLNNVL